MLFELNNTNQIVCGCGFVPTGIEVSVQDAGRGRYLVCMKPIRAVGDGWTKSGNPDETYTEGKNIGFRSSKKVRAELEEEVLGSIAGRRGHYWHELS